MNIIENSLTFKSMDVRKSTNMIILHHAAATSCTVEDIHRWHLNNGWSGIGYHYFVRKDGSIYRGRPENTVGAHAKGSNANSIGICFEGNFETEQMTAEQMTAGIELVRDILTRYDIKRIALHKEVCATACPGANFPSETFKALLYAEPEVISTPTAEPVSSRSLVLEFQHAALDDGFKLPKYGADGMWGNETAAVAAKTIVRQRSTYRYPALTRLVQSVVGVTADGKCGKNTDSAIRAWQKSNGLTVDGAWGIQCWRKWVGV